MFENCHPRRSSSNYPRSTKKMPKGDGGDGGVEVLFELVGRVCWWNAAAAASDQLFKAPWREHRLGKRERERGRRKEGRKEGGVFLRSRGRRRQPNFGRGEGNWGINLAQVTRRARGPAADGRAACLNWKLELWKRNPHSQPTRRNPLTVSHTSKPLTMQQNDNRRDF